MIKVRFNGELKSFSIQRDPPSSLLSIQTWKSSFKRFLKKIIEEECLKDYFSKSTKSPRKFTYDFSTESMNQLIALDLLVSDDKFRKIVTISYPDLRDELQTRVKNIIGSTFDKLGLMKNGHPLGYELLKLQLQGIEVYSIESHDCHRILYSPKFQYNQVKIWSLVGHYNDPPRLPIDYCILTAVQMVSESSRSQKDINRDFKKLLDRYDRKYKIF